MLVNSTAFLMRVLISFLLFFFLFFLFFSFSELPSVWFYFHNNLAPLFFSLLTLFFPHVRDFGVLHSNSFFVLFFLFPCVTILIFSALWTFFFSLLSSLQAKLKQKTGEEKIEQHFSSLKIEWFLPFWLRVPLFLSTVAVLRSAFYIARISCAWSLGITLISLVRTIDQRLTIRTYIYHTYTYF